MMDTVEIYEVLVRQHEAMLYAYLLGVVRDPVLAEDIAQEAFVIGFQKLDTLRDKECFAAWLRTIARNLAMTALRKRSRELQLNENMAQGMEDIFEAFDEDYDGETWEQRVRILEDCFNRLPDKMREICRMHYYEDLPVKGITEALKISMDAVKKRLERARDALRECAEKRLELEEG